MRHEGRSSVTRNASPIIGTTKMARDWACGALFLACFVLPGCGERAGEGAPAETPELSQPTDFDHGFWSIQNVWEQTDGTLLVLDRREGALLSLDPESGEVSTVLWDGEGPQEVRSFGNVIRLAGDTLVAMMPGNAAFQIIADGEIAGQRSVPVDIAGRPQRDTIGHWLVTLGAGNTASGGASTQHLVRFLGGEDGAPTDTVRTREVEGSSAFTSLRRGEDAPVDVRDFDARTHERLAPDGWVAVLHPDPYRVEWLDPDGQWHRGDELSFEAVPVDADLRRDILERLRSLPREGEQMDHLVANSDDVSELPPYLREADDPGGVLFAPDGQLLVLRSQLGVSDSTRYDVLARDGTRSGQIRLGPRERIIASSPDALYVVVRDEVDLQYLRRIPVN